MVETSPAYRKVSVAAAVSLCSLCWGSKLLLGVRDGSKRASGQGGPDLVAVKQIPCCCGVSGVTHSGRSKRSKTKCRHSRLASQARL